MNVQEVLLICAAGLWAGFINAVVGSGSLITFPTLIALGFPPVSANVSNNIGLVAGGVRSIWGYRTELAVRRSGSLRLVPLAAIGSLMGALLLLILPGRVFNAVVPVLIVLALIMVIAQPRIVATLSRSSEVGAGAGAPSPGGRPQTNRQGVPPVAGALALHETAAQRPRWATVSLRVGVLATGVYGGYFGAAQGIILLGLLGALHESNLQRANAVKNVIGTAVNLVAALVFVIVSPAQVNWRIVALIAASSVIGAGLGARWGRRLSGTALRVVIVAVGTFALARFAWSAL